MTKEIMIIISAIIAKPFSHLTLIGFFGAWSGGPLTFSSLFCESLQVSAIII